MELKGEGQSQSGRTNALSSPPSQPCPVFHCPTVPPFPPQAFPGILNWDGCSHPNTWTLTNSVGPYLGWSVADKPLSSTEIRLELEVKFNHTETEGLTAQASSAKAPEISSELIGHPAPQFLFLTKTLFCMKGECEAKPLRRPALKTFEFVWQ